MGPTWGRQDPGGPHVGTMNFVTWVIFLVFLDPPLSINKLFTTFSLHFEVICSPINLASCSWKIDNSTVFCSLVSRSWCHRTGAWHLSANHAFWCMTGLLLIGSWPSVTLFGNWSNCDGTLCFVGKNFKNTPQARPSIKHCSTYLLMGV